MKYKDKPSMTIRPPIPRPIPKTCEHKYRLFDSNITSIHADGYTLIKDIDVIFYCEKCLDIKHKQEHIHMEGKGDV